MKKFSSRFRGSGKVDGGSSFLVDFYRDEIVIGLPRDTIFPLCTSLAVTAVKVVCGFRFNGCQDVSPFIRLPETIFSS